MRGLTESHVVVCVDDEQEILSALRRSLRGEPYQLLTTLRPKEALKWVGDFDVSLVMSDQRMPEILGTELLEEIRDRSPVTARAILTAYPEGTVALRGVRQRIDAVISKPWDNRMLKETIREMLRDRELSEADEWMDPRARG